MFKQTLVMAIVASTVFVCNVPAAQINSNWIGGDGLWEQANNWNPNIIPNNNADTFNVTIHGGIIDDDLVTVGIDFDCTIDQFVCDGFLKLTARHASLTIDNGGQLRNNGDLEIEDDFTVIGDVVNTADSGIQSNGMKFIIIGNLFNDPNGYIETDFFMMANHGGSDSKGFITNNGTIEIWPNGQLLSDRNFKNYGQISILDSSCQADHHFTNYSTGNINGHGTLYGWWGLRNYGTISASGGSLSIISDSAFSNNGTLFSKPSTSIYVKAGSDVNNHGLVAVSMGSSIAFECNLVNNPDGTLRFNGGVLAAKTIVQKENATFEGFGGITGNVIIEDGGIIKLTGPTNIVGDVNIATNATLEVSDGVTLVAGQTTNNGTIHMKGGRLIPQGGITNNGNVIWEPGLYNNVADFNLDGQVNLLDFADFSETWLWQSGL